MSKPYWDDGDIDVGIRNAVEAINKLPDIETMESCEGHGKNPYSFIVFLYKKDGSIPFWAERVLKASLRTGLCLGCLRVRLRMDYHFDCANDLKKGWWLEIIPRRDYGSRDAKQDMIKVWEEIAEEFISISKEI